MLTLADLEQARHQAESLRLFVERLAGAEAILRLAIEAQQWVASTAQRREQLQEEQAALQLARNELEHDLADLRAQKQEMLDAIVAEGKERLASLEQERRHAANAFELDVKQHTETIAQLLAEEDRLHKLCHKHRTQLGRVKAEVLRVLQDEEDA